MPYAHVATAMVRDVHEEMFCDEECESVESAVINTGEVGTLNSV